MQDLKKYSVALLLTFLGIELISSIILSLYGIGPFQDPNYTRNRASGYYCFGNRPNTQLHGFDGFDNNTYSPSQVPFTTDEHGLISDMPIIMGKQKDVIKIILRGGSAMFGSLQTQGVSDDPTYPHGEYSFKSSIAGILQDTLQKIFPAKKIQVINAAVVQHTFSLNYSMYVSLLHFFKPDFIVSMDGYNDLFSLDQGDFYSNNEVISDEFIQIEAEKRSKHFPYSAFLVNYLFNTVVTKNNPVTATGKEDLDIPQFIKKDQLAEYEKNESYFANNSRELFWMIDAYSAALTQDSIYPIVCLQPMLGRKDIQKILTPLERSLLKATQQNGRVGLVEQYYWGLYFAPRADSILQKNKGVFLDLGKTIATRMNGKQEAFVDYCHLTYAANKQVAFAIAGCITAHLGKNQTLRVN